MMGERSPVGLHFVENGPTEGKPLVMSGSLGSTLDMWQPQRSAFPGRRVIRIDHRGHGGSPVPAGPYTVAELAGDVVALLDKLGCDQVDFIGLSLGGMIGMYLASETPQRIGRLALLSTSSGFPDKEPWLARIDAVAVGGTEAVADAVVRNWLTPDYAAEHPDAVAWFTDMLRGTPPAGYLACCQALRDWDHAYRLSAITAPTLAIWGTEDPATPEQPHGATIAEAIPGIRFERVAAAHLLSVERADEVNALLTEHFAAD
ncbi:MAG TPA: 3-oxoadipate enol-lactonase [Pseudonocardia sp.]|jgi:3-oxoadipate enol-lactonase|uniref:3-oxoadipate enol-lactonase n=1 Tax=Pseudonocardia sp. TaxID=60912 RepID=UPI002F41B04A